MGEGGKNGYGHIPVGIARVAEERWIGLILINTNAQDVQISTSSSSSFLSTSLTHKTIGGIIDYYIVVAYSPEEAIKGIRKIMGFPFLPPYWSLGMHQCRYGYNTFENFKNLYE